MWKFVQVDKGVVALTLAVCVLSAGGAVGRPADEKMPTWLTAEVRQPAPGADQLQKLRVARYNAALQELQARGQELLAGRITLDVLLDAADHLRDASLALGDKPVERILVFEQAVELGKFVEAILDAKFESGMAKVADVARARYWRLDAEVRLLEEKRKAEKPKSP